MANQRMYLACEVCLSKKKKPLESCIDCAGKYYPSLGWFSPYTDKDSLREFFKKHEHKTLLGKYIRIVYDSELFDFAKSRDKILAIVKKL